MNKTRRAQIVALRTALADLGNQIIECMATATSILDDEQEAFDMSGSLQDSEKGQAAQAAIHALSEAVCALGWVSGDLSDADGSLGTAEE